MRNVMNVKIWNAEIYFIVQVCPAGQQDLQRRH
jgi:hypothetical protein